MNALSFCRGGSHESEELDIGDHDTRSRYREGGAPDLSTQKIAVEDTAVVHPWYAARLVWQHRSDASPFMVGQLIARDSKLPVLKLESQGCDRSQYCLDSLRPGLKSAFRGEET
jgi:hypothetical protein